MPGQNGCRIHQHHHPNRKILARLQIICYYERRYLPKMAEDLVLKALGGDEEAASSECEDERGPSTPRKIGQATRRPMVAHLGERNLAEKEKILWLHSHQHQRPTGCFNVSSSVVTAFPYGRCIATSAKKAPSSGSRKESHGCSSSSLLSGELYYRSLTTRL